MKWVKTFLWILVFMIAVLFSIQNKTDVTLQFVLLPIENFQWIEASTVPLPLFLVILCSVFLGILIGGISDLYKRFQLKKTLRHNQKTIEKLEKEIQLLRGPNLDQPSFLKKDNESKRRDPS